MSLMINRWNPIEFIGLAFIFSNVVVFFLFFSNGFFTVELFISTVQLLIPPLFFFLLYIEGQFQWLYLNKLEIVLSERFFLRYPLLCNINVALSKSFFETSNLTTPISDVESIFDWVFCPPFIETTICSDSSLGFTIWASSS